MEKAVFKDFAKYVSFNIFGMIGLSCYILADTFFVAKALGATGITALNFAISIYSVIHGIGLMIGIGGATRYRILRIQNEDSKVNIIFTTCIKLGVFIGVIFVTMGIFGSKALAMILGADPSTLPFTNTYLKTILCFAPFYITNNIILAFVRNDDNPKLSMIAMLTGSFSNIVLDYIFMFPLGMGMFGAAFATGLAPVVSVGILSIHFFKRKNNIRWIRIRVIWSCVCNIFSLGLSAFITEVSSAIVLITFNLAILRLEGNLGVASYGIIANIALVGVSVFTGIAQGIQPVVSKGYGMQDYEVIRKVLRLALFTSLAIASIIYFSMFFNTDRIISFFNSEHNLNITRIAKTGLRIYFIGFFFAGINIIIAAFLSATERATDAFFISVARGCIIIVPLVLLLGRIWKMTGIWLAFVISECMITMIIIFMACFHMKRDKER
ncbi:MAG: multi antimicrobial extrusion protein MatE [Lachnospiraceae bacterium]|jgi:putative MATE family efflux protein|nr:multi antimicrobial extrusion protein MatE [Lachnospiraceae bacterium]